MNILAIESSCDETAAAVIENGTTIRSSVVASSASLHQKYGGILPELAARKQVEFILPVIKQSVLDAFTADESKDMYSLIEKHIDAIAVTIGPGLIGSLLIGVEAAKTISYSTKKPLIPINHVFAHIYANFVNKNPIQFPAIALVVSGGHTELFLMKDEKTIEWLAGTIDDAAGEAFDKTGRLLGFGNRGGAAIEEAAALVQASSNMLQVTFPRPMMHDDTLNFSFSGLKTAVLKEWTKHTNSAQPTTHPSTSSGSRTSSRENTQLISLFSYEIQEAITDVLVKKTLQAVEIHEAKSVLAAGGVAANQRLRDKFLQDINVQPTTHNLQLFFPPKELCTDNAVSIGVCAYYLGKSANWDSVAAIPNLAVEVG